MIINDPAVLAEVEAAFAAYEAALGSNDVATLDRLFRNYVQGPDCAGLLALVVEHVRAQSGGAA